MDVFFDTNVVVTAKIGRTQDSSITEQEIASAQQLWQMLEDDRLAGYLAGFSVPTIFSIAEREFKERRKRAGWDWRKAELQSRRDALNIIDECYDLLNVCRLFPVDIEAALDLTNKEFKCSDFEDNLQLVCAAEEKVNVLVTFNKRDFGCAYMFKVEVVSPSQLLSHI